MPDWHGRKGMWVDRILDSHCDFEVWPDPWSWPLIFKDKFWKSHNSGIGCLIHMERNGCESTECRTHIVTFNFDFTYDLDLEFSMSNFEIAVSRGVTIHLVTIWFVLRYTACDTLNDTIFPIHISDFLFIQELSIGEDLEDRIHG